ncbi:MAG: uridine kinase [Gemmataceae bacterium]
MFILGIAGGSGSGKSTIVDQLLELPDAPPVAHLPHDAYYHTRSLMPTTVRDTENWDHPDALDNDLFVEHLQQLKAGHPVERPVYDFSKHARASATIRVAAGPVLVVEGILVFALPAIRELMDLKVYIDTPADLRILRRLQRDVNERGRTVDSVVQQYHGTVRPMHDRFVEPSKRFADVVVPWELRNVAAVQMLAATVRSRGR